MGLRKVALVIADISGYTRFIRYNDATLEHASEAIRKLLELVATHASHPLRLNKLEGDAVFLFAELETDEAAGVADVTRQVFELFPLFRQKIVDIAQDRSVCPCDACRSVMKLRLKVILHSGRVAQHTILGHDELAGEDVILVHRLLKNSVDAHEYVAMTPVFRGLAGSLAGLREEVSIEHPEGFGVLDLHVFHPEPAEAVMSADQVRDA